jgi:hypothetical protein
MRILRGVSSRLLPCGCLTGVYETYDGDIVTIVDAPSESCADPSHTNGNVIPGKDVSATRSHRGSARSRD